MGVIGAWSRNVRELTEKGARELAQDDEKGGTVGTARGEPICVPLPTPEGMVSPEERDDLFRRELETVINRHSRENGSDTPDFILAQYLADCLAAWDRAMALRTEWYRPKRHTISGSDAADDDL